MVNPGDLVLGDNDGIVIVPQGEIENVLKAAQERAEKEEKKAQALASGVTGVELNNLDEVFQSLGMIEETA